MLYVGDFTDIFGASQGEIDCYLYGLYLYKII